MAAESSAPMISVIVPTYRRTADLRRCLEALAVQTRMPEEILVIVRDSDEVTHAFWAEHSSRFPWAQMIISTQPGQVAALNAGLRAARGEIVAFTDDDAAPRPRWLELAAAHLERDPKVGAVGGRDWIHWQGAVTKDCAPVVGRITATGRLIGHHHLGAGPAREVDFLKGCNMIFRRAAIGQQRFDERLKGGGAEVHNDLAFCLGVRRHGWKVVYDPEVAINHYVGQRVEDVERGDSSALNASSIAFNEGVVFGSQLRGWERIRTLGWLALVGTASTPGLVRAILSPRGFSLAAVCLAFASRWQGLWAGRRPAVQP